MKRFVSLLSVLALVLSLYACSDGNTSVSEAETTAYDITEYQPLAERTVSLSDDLSDWSTEYTGPAEWLDIEYENEPLPSDVPIKLSEDELGWSGAPISFFAGEGEELRLNFTPEPTYRFIRNGKLVRKITENIFDSPSSFYVTTYKYNEQGLLSEEKEYNSKGTADKVCRYSYDSGGNMTRKVIYREDGTLSLCKEYRERYGSFCQTIRFDYYNNGDNIYVGGEIEYVDDRGSQGGKYHKIYKNCFYITNKKIDFSRSETSGILQLLDKDGIVVTESNSSAPMSEADSVLTENATYDDNRNCTSYHSAYGCDVTKSSKSKYGSDGFILEYCEDYFGKYKVTGRSGKLITETRHTDNKADDGSSPIVKLERDSNGRITEVTEADSSGNINKRTIIESDENGFNKNLDVWSYSHGFGDYKSHEKYLSSSGIPKADELGSYEKAEYLHIQKNNSLNNTFLIVVSYSPEEYKLQKKSFDEKYTKRIRLGSTCDFSIGSFDMRKTNQTLGYETCFALAGTSDKKSSIAYLYCDDSDIIAADLKDSDKLKEITETKFEYDW